MYTIICCFRSTCVIHILNDVKYLRTGFGHRKKLVEILNKNCLHTNCILKIIYV